MLFVYACEQEAISLLSGQKCMPPGSILTLAQGALLLSDLRGAKTTTLLKLTQKLLKKQVRMHTCKRMYTHIYIHIQIAQSLSYLVLFLCFFQLCVFGQSMALDEGKMCVSPPGSSNIYLPYHKILDQTTLQIDK